MQISAQLKVPFIMLWNPFLSVYTMMPEEWEQLLVTTPESDSLNGLLSQHMLENTFLQIHGRKSFKEWSIPPKWLSVNSNAWDLNHLKGTEA